MLELRSEWSDAIPIVNDPRWLLARRIARSRTFARSEQLRKLLLHLCRMAVAGRADELNEQRIGISVFRRAPGYDPNVDGIVRSHATRLRYKLDAYFLEEGSQEIERIEIPRGGYVPRFFTAPPPPPSIEETPVVELSAEQQGLVDDAPASDTTEVASSRLSRVYLVLVFVLLQVVVFAAMWLHFSSRRVLPGTPTQSSSPVVQHFWQSLLAPSQRTVVVPGDSGLVLYETIAEADMSLTQYLSGTYRDVERSPAKDSPRISREFLINLANRSYTSLADVRLVESLTRLPQWNTAHLEILSARELDSSQASESNLILLGSRQANPWISIIEPRLNFVLKRGEGGTFNFQNRHPGPGELPVYAAHKAEGNVGGWETYGHIAYLPNPGGKGNILALDGIWNSGTLSAGNFVLHNESFVKWLTSVVRLDGSIPPFEILIRTTDVNNSPTASAIVSARVIPDHETA